MNTAVDIDASKEQVKTWLSSHKIVNVECLVPDLAGIARGKVLSTERFIEALQSDGLHLAESLYSQDVRGITVATSVVSELEPDITLKVNPDTLRLIPWASTATAAVICDAYHPGGEIVEIASRQVLHRVVDEFSNDGLRATVAPELEFYVTQMHEDPTQPVCSPTVRSGARETGAQTYGIDILSEFSPLFDELNAYCKTLGIAAEVLTHEAGCGQFEVNIAHGDPLKKADEVFLFKRAAREAALKNDKMITFMAKPIASEPGNAMHIHQSINRINDGSNIFANQYEQDSQALHHYIGGLQKYTPATLLMVAPYVNSYKRFVPDQFAPVNMHWSHENRTAGFRVPHSNGKNRRVENRIIGSDSNPYLATAATLACGLLGLRHKVTPFKEMRGNAYRSKNRNLPEYLLQAIDTMRRCKTLTQVFDKRFIALMTELKYAEYQLFLNTITPWEREHLLYTV